MKFKNIKTSSNATLLTFGKLVLPDCLSVVRSDWFNGSDIQELLVPRSVETIQNEAFAECQNLKRITFAEGS